MDDYTVRPRLRTEKLSKVFVSPPTKELMLDMLIDCGTKIGPGGAAGLILEEMRRQGLIRALWQVQQRRYEGGTDAECRDLLVHLVLGGES